MICNSVGYQSPSHLRVPHNPLKSMLKLCFPGCTLLFIQWWREDCISNRFPRWWWCWSGTNMLWEPLSYTVTITTQWKNKFKNLKFLWAFLIEVQCHEHLYNNLINLIGKIKKACCILGQIIKIWEPSFIFSSWLVALHSFVSYRKNTHSRLFIQ